MANDSVPFSKKGERKISSFVGQELLYDYVTSHLDAERTSAIEEYVKSSREAQADIQRINDGLSYVDHLADIHVSDALLETLKTPSSYLQVLLRKLRFDDWSPGIKMGLEVMVVAIGVISITLVIPWHKLMDISWTGKKEIVLTEVQKGSMAAQDVEVAGSPEESTVVFPDDGDKKAAAVVVAKPAQEVAEPKPIMNVSLTSVLPTVVPVPSGAAAEAHPVAATAPKPTVKEAPVKVAANAPMPSTATPTAVATNSTATEKHQGYLYRGVLRVTNLNAVLPKFVDKINELGGRKAGEVELGWKKSGNSGYFHFTMPEAKYQALLDFAQAYGGLTLQKEKHERVMPEGIVRIIFSLEEKK